MCVWEGVGLSQLLESLWFHISGEFSSGELLGSVPSLVLTNIFPSNLRVQGTVCVCCIGGRKRDR